MSSVDFFEELEKLKLFGKSLNKKLKMFELGQETRMKRFRSESSVPRQKFQHLENSYHNLCLGPVSTIVNWPGLGLRLLPTDKQNDASMATQHTIVMRFVNNWMREFHDLKKLINAVKFMQVIVS